MIYTKWFFGDKNIWDAHFIRRKVFIEEQGINESDEMDGTDPSCIHVVVYMGAGEPVATGRIMVLGGEFYIGRVAVLPEYRGQQLGVLVMQSLIHASYSMGGEKQIIHAQLAVKGFYEKLGFYAIGDEFEEAGIPHIEMIHEGDVKRLCKT